MQMKLDGTTLILIQMTNSQFTIIKSWNKMRWNAKLKQLEGTADLELLDKLAGISGLTPSVAAHRRDLRQVPAVAPPDDPAGDHLRRCSRQHHGGAGLPQALAQGGGEDSHCGVFGAGDVHRTEKRLSAANHIFRQNISSSLAHIP